MGTRKNVNAADAREAKKLLKQLSDEQATRIPSGNRRPEHGPDKLPIGARKPSLEDYDR